jgi:AraC-like DNA-binding protein
MAHPFLATAVVSLCARYLSVHEAQHEFGKALTREVYKYASTLARRFARESSDQPSGISTKCLE